jgi:hypothetical protein
MVQRVPPVSGCAFGVAPAAADEHDELTAAEQRGEGLGIERQSDRDEVVDPGLDAAGCAEQSSQRGLRPSTRCRADWSGHGVRPSE